MSDAGAAPAKAPSPVIRFGIALIALGVVGVIGLTVKQPWLFPSLGPTVMLIVEAPQLPASRLGNVVIGHAVGIAVGWVCLVSFRLSSLPPAPVGGLTGRYVAAGALSVAVTTLVLGVLNRQHPPAGASTLIVSLGILTTAAQLATMLGAVIVVAVIAWELNRLAGAKPDQRW